MAPDLRRSYFWDEMGLIMTAETNSLLIVDDEELNLEGLARRLQRHGFAVTVTKSGEDAIELLVERHFDLVLLDIMMPGMNGLEVLKFLRRVDSLIDLPIVMMTARGESEDMVEALELGANDYVTKPHDLPVVLARIRTQLALKRAVSQVTDLKQKLNARNKELEASVAERAPANESMKRDLEAGARVQQALLPFLPPEVPGGRFACAFKPCRQLAGDFVSLFRLDERHLGLAVLDANGHGVAAALLTVAVNHLLARLSSPPSAPAWCSPGQASKAPVSPAQVVGQLSQQLFGEAAAAQPFTLLYGILSLDTWALRFISAGHPGPVHLPRGSPPAVLEVTGFPVGVGTGSYREQVVELRPGDRLVLYSDGVTEARNAEGEHFGIRRLLSALEQTRRVPLAESLNTLVTEVERWHGDTPRNDDISILAVERADPGSEEDRVVAEPSSRLGASRPPPQRRPGKGTP
jgi:sigma-B regulation protein RsbU (phosphoserine phosphatase)